MSDGLERIREKRSRIPLAAVLKSPIQNSWTRRANALTQGRPARPPIAYPPNRLWFGTHGLGTNKGNVMRWSPLLSVVIGLSIATGRLLSQETPVDEGSDSPPSPPQSILRDSHAAQFHLVLGRIELDSIRYRKGTISRTRGDKDSHAAFHETLSIDATRGVPRLHYTRQTPTQRLTLDINERNRLSIESEMGRERVTLIQEIGRPISIHHYNENEVSVDEVDTWIHFYMSHCATYRRHLQPLVDDMIHAMPISELAERAHARSIESLSSTSSTNDVTLQHYIAMLGSTQRSQRVAAQRELHLCGISLLPRLKQIDFQQLDAEQRHRLEQVIRQLTPRGDDCESRVAALIRDDQTYWTAASNRLTGAQRILITARMSDLGGSDVLRVAKSKEKSAVRVAALAADDDGLRR